MAVNIWLEEAETSITRVARGTGSSDVRWTAARPPEGAAEGFDVLDAKAKEVLGVLYRHNRYCRMKPVSAKQASFALWHEMGGLQGDIKEFDTFYRRIRNIFNKLEKADYVRKVEGTRGYVLRDDHDQTHVI